MSKPKQETSPSGILAARVVTASVLAAGGGVSFLCRTELSMALGNATFWITMAAVCGAFGALLSAISHSGKMRFIFTAAHLLHYRMTFPYLFVGALTGLAVVLDIHIEDVLSYIPKHMRPAGALTIAGSTSALLEQLGHWLLASGKRPAD